MVIRVLGSSDHLAVSWAAQHPDRCVVKLLGVDWLARPCVDPLESVPADPRSTCDFVSSVRHAVSDPMRKELATVVHHHPDRCVDEVVGRLVQRDQVLRILGTDVADHATDADGDCKCGWCFCRDVVVSLCHVCPFLCLNSCGLHAVLAIGEWGEQSAGGVVAVESD